jgi:phosphomannomutase
MYTKFFKKNPLLKFINYVVLVSFLCTSVLVRSYAGMCSSDTLRKAAAKNDGTDKKIIRMLTDKNQEALLSNGIIHTLSPLSDALKKIYLSDINSVVAKIVPYIPKGIAADELSFMVCKDGLWVLGPEQEAGMQVFVRFSSDFQRSFPSEINKILKDAKAEVIKKGNIEVVSVPASEPYARRQMTYYTFSQVISEKKSITNGLTYEQPAYSVTPLMERMIFGAKLEREFLDGFQEGADSARKEYPELVEFINHLQDPNSGPFELRIPVKKWNLKERVYEKVKKLARVAVAGMREVKNPEFDGDLKKTVNRVLLLLVGNELAEMALEQAQKDGRKSIDAIVAGEVRYDTALLNEQLRRRFAALGITVHSPPRGTYLPIGATSFITTFLDMMFTVYSTSSHSGRAIYSDKLMGFQEVTVSPLVEEYLKETGIDVKEYKKARSEGAQLLIEKMVELADRIGKRIDGAGDFLVIKFAGGNDKNIHFDIQNPSSSENKDVIGEYGKYLKDGFVSDTHIKTVNQALSDGMQMGFYVTRGAAFNFFKGVYKEVFGEKTAESIHWLDTMPDPFFGDTGMTDYNKQQVPDESLSKYVAAIKDRLDTHFSNQPFRSSVLAEISTQEMARVIKDNSFGKEEAATIQVRFTVFAREQEDLLKKIGMRYIILSRGRILAYYKPKLADISEDISMLEVVNASKLPAFMSDKPVGFILPVTDPDGDRYVLLQIEKNDKATKELLKRFNVGYLVLSDEKLLVVYVPNQTFLQDEVAYIQQLKDEHKFSQQIDNPDAITFFSIKTTVSSGTWLQVDTAEGVPVVQVPVGFKEIDVIMRKVEFQLQMNKVRRNLGLAPRMAVVHDIFGRAIRLGYNPRLLSGSEESGGRIKGKFKLLETKDGYREYLSWREKNAVDPSISMLIEISKRFIQAKEDALGRGVEEKGLYNDAKFLQDISLSKWLSEINTRYQMKNTAELRSDIELVDFLAAAKLPEAEAKKLKDAAEKRRDTNFTFFLGLAFALQDGHITLNEVKSILKEVLLSDEKMVKKIITITDATAPDILIKQIDDLKRYVFIGDAVYLEFSNGAWQIIRPSGTDPKIKSYPSTDNPIVSAVISNAIGEVHPTIFFEMGAGKSVPNMPVTTEYVKKMQKSDPVLLDVDKIKATQQEKYERGLKVDTTLEWSGDQAVQKLLEERFPESAAGGRKVCSVNLFLGPASQKESLRYDPESHIIYASWDFDDSMRKAANKAELFQKSFVLDGGDRKTREFMPLTPIKLIPGMELKVFNIAEQMYEGLSNISSGFATVISKEAWQKIAVEIIGNDLVPLLPTVNIDRLYDESVRVAGLIFSEVNAASHGAVGIDFDIFVKNAGAILATQIELPPIGNRGLTVEEKVTLALANLKDTAKKLGVSPKELMGFLLADNRIFTAIGGETAFIEYLNRAGNEILKAQNLSVNNKAALVVHASFLKKGGALDALHAITKMGAGVKLGIYGPGAEQIKDMIKNISIDNDNVVAANTLEELMRTLKKEGVSRQENIVVLKPVQERITSEIKQIGFSEKTISTVAVAKAMEALSNTKNTKAAFEKFYGDLNKKGVISTETYEKTRKEVTAGLQEGKLDLPDMSIQKISDTVEKDADSVAAFVEKYI